MRVERVNGEGGDRRAKAGEGKEPVNQNRVTTHDRPWTQDPRWTSGPKVRVTHPRIVVHWEFSLGVSGSKRDLWGRVGVVRVVVIQYRFRRLVPRERFRSRRVMYDRRLEGREGFVRTDRGKMSLPGSPRETGSVLPGLGRTLVAVD